MLREGETPVASIPRARVLLLSTVIMALMAMVGYAVQREMTPNIANEQAAMRSPVPEQALSAEEEAYAAALWPIHSEVKLSAVEMSFAGIAYKTEGRDAQRLAATLQPLADGFNAAIVRASALQVPASMQAVHDRYLEALELYGTATMEMAKVAKDGRDEHLIEAQAKSFRAAENALRVGDVLWPGEYKPH